MHKLAAHQAERQFAIVCDVSMPSSPSEDRMQWRRCSSKHVDDLEVLPMYRVDDGMRSVSPRVIADGEKDHQHIHWIFGGGNLWIVCRLDDFSCLLKTLRTERDAATLVKLQAEKTAGCRDRRGSRVDPVAFGGLPSRILFSY